MYRILLFGPEALASKLGLRISGSVGWLVGLLDSQRATPPTCLLEAVAACCLEERCG
jgi:hypothetical protein